MICVHTYQCLKLLDSKGHSFVYTNFSNYNDTIWHTDIEDDENSVFLLNGYSMDRNLPAIQEVFCRYKYCIL